MIAVTHGHGDHVGDTVELSKAFPQAQVVAQVELKSWLGGQGALDRRPAPGLNKGGTQEIDGVHFTLVNAFHSSSSNDARVPRRVVRDRDPARRRPRDLLRRRHVRVRRHGPDRPPLRARLRRAADRRPLHDGPARGRARARAARKPAVHPLPLRDVPAPDRAPRSSSGSRRRTPRSTRSSPARRSFSDATPVVATYSIAACDLGAGQWGVATQSKFLAVGSVVPWATPRRRARSRRRRTRTRATAPTGSRCSSEGARGRGGRRRG